MFKEIYEKYILRYYILFIILGVVIVFSSIAFIFIYSNSSQNQNSSIVNTSETIEEVQEIESEEENYVYVDIKGAITKPSVYQMKEGSRVVDVIKQAGGLTTKADTSILNLSKKVSDEMVIIVYTKDEINDYKSNNKTKEEIIKYIEKDCICPDPNLNDACNNTDNLNDKNELSPNKISLNNATKEELMTLPGIGEAKAQDIIDYRISNNLFKDITELKNVSGIGDNTFDQIKNLITL